MLVGYVGLLYYITHLLTSTSERNETDICVASDAGTNVLLATPPSLVRVRAPGRPPPFVGDFEVCHPETVLLSLALFEP